MLKKCRTGSKLSWRYHTPSQYLMSDQTAMKKGCRRWIDDWCACSLLLPQSKIIYSMKNSNEQKAVSIRHMRRSSPGKIMKDTDPHAFLPIAGFACSFASAQYGTFISASCINGCRRNSWYQSDHDNCRGEMHCIDSWYKIVWRRV